MKLCHWHSIRLRLAHWSFAYSNRKSRVGTISSKWSRNTMLHLFIKVWAYKWAIFFVDTDECWCSGEILECTRWFNVGGSWSTGRSVAVVLFKKLNIETRVNTRHPFPHESKRMRLYRCAYTNAAGSCISIRKHVRVVSNYLLSTIVS